MKFVIFLRTPFYTEHLQWLLVNEKHNLFTFVEKTAFGTLKEARTKFIGVDKLLCFISISKFGRFDIPLAMIIGLTELWLERMRSILLVEMKEVIPMTKTAAKAAEIHGNA